MTYVIIRIPDGAFVARPGSKGSYTRSLQFAQTFESRESADKNRCQGNEQVYSTDDVFRALSIGD